MFNSVRGFISGLGSQNFQQPEVSEKAKVVDFVDLLPSEMSVNIFSYLNRKELAKCLLVNKTWKVLASDEALWNALALRIAFGKNQWERYFGDIGKEPPLPKDIHKILKSPCPFFPEKKVEETHMLVLIPETVNGKPLNLITLGEHVRSPKKGHPAHYRRIGQVIKEHGNQSPDKSYWVLMTKDVIPGSRNKSYADQQTLVSDLAKQTGIDYEIPNVLDAVICIFVRDIGFGERLFAIEEKDYLSSLVYTLCQEKTHGHQVGVGAFHPEGLTVATISGTGSIIGVAALRKLF